MLEVCKTEVICQAAGSLPSCRTCPHGRLHREVWEYPGPKKCTECWKEGRRHPFRWTGAGITCHCRCIRVGNEQATEPAAALPTDARSGEEA